MLNIIGLLGLTALIFMVTWATGGEADSWLRFAVRGVLSLALIWALLKLVDRLDHIEANLIANNLPVQVFRIGRRIRRVERALSSIARIEYSEWLGMEKSGDVFVSEQSECELATAYERRFSTRMLNLCGGPDFHTMTTVSLWVSPQFLYENAAISLQASTTADIASKLKGTVRAENNLLCLADLTIEAWETHLLVHNHNFVCDDPWVERRTKCFYGENV